MSRITEAEALGFGGHPDTVARFVQAIAPFAPRYVGSHMDQGELVTRYEIGLDDARIYVEIRS